MGGGIRFRTKSPERTVKRGHPSLEDFQQPHTTGSKSKKHAVLIAHDNATPGHTDKAHALADELDKDPHFRVVHDRDMWDRGERTSSSEIDRREREMVVTSEVVVRIMTAPSKTGQERHEGAEREVRKAIHANKPVIEIFENGAHESPDRSQYDLNYTKRVAIHLQPGQHLMTGVKLGIKELKRKGVLDPDFPEPE
jgi:hypothetical protein